MRQEGGAGGVRAAAVAGVGGESTADAVEASRQAGELGIAGGGRFPEVDSQLKGAVGTEGTSPDGLVPETIRAIKAAVPEIGVITDVALDCYTDHGHDGIVEDGRIINDGSLERLAEQAFIHAHAGADVVAPSDMMDGRVQAIREALEANGYQEGMIRAYAAK